MISVHNAAELSAALSSAVGGETISLAAGDYGTVNINKAFASGVTITSADHNNEAHIESLVVNNSTNLNFYFLDIGGPLNGQAEYTPRADVENSTNINFDHVHVHGTLNNNPGDDGDGLRILYDTNVSVTNSEFEQLRRALGFGDSHTGLYANNTFHDLRTTGIEVGGATDLTIKGNSFKDFYWLPGDHFDAIQLHTAGSSFQTQNVSVSDNVILQGNGLAVQGIFAQDEIGTMPYKNLSITNNLVYESTWNGILVRGADGLTIAHNTVVTPTTDAFEERLWVESVTNVTLSQNVADVIVRSGTNGTINEAGDVSLHDTPMHFPNINAGAAVKPLDVILPLVGYQATQAPAQTVAAPTVSKALASSLATIFHAHGHQSAEVSKTYLPVDMPVQHHVLDHFSIA